MTSRWQRSTPQGSSPHLTEQSAHAVGGTAIWSCDPRRRGLPPFGALHMAPFARGPESTVFTASLRKSAEPAYWPRLVPALGQRCTRAGERSAGLFVCVTRTTRTCPNIHDLILKCTKTHESAQLGLGTQICVIILAILGLGTRTREVRERIVIKQSNAAQKSKNQIPLGYSRGQQRWQERRGWW